MTITVIIVNWNAGSLLGPCIESVLRQRRVSAVRVVVVDNASSDNSVAVLQQYEDLEHVEVVFSDQNLGFSRANNLGLRRCATEYVVFLNPDTEFLDDDGLSRLVTELHDQSVGLVGPHLRNPDGTTQQSCAAFPTVRSVITTGFGIHFLLPDSMRRRLAPVAWSQDRTTDTDWLRGACLAMRVADCRSLGGFSEATFMYAEDLDLAYRVRRQGKRVRYLAEVNVKHVDDYSSSQRWTDAQKAAKVVTADLVFLRTWKPTWQAGLIRVLLVLAYGMRGVLLPMLSRPERGAVYRAMATAALRGTDRKSM